MISLFFLFFSTSLALLTPNDLIKNCNPVHEQPFLIDYVNFKQPTSTTFDFAKGSSVFCSGCNLTPSLNASVVHGAFAGDELFINLNVTKHYSKLLANVTFKASGANFPANYSFILHKPEITQHGGRYVGFTYEIHFDASLGAMNGSTVFYLGYRHGATWRRCRNNADHECEWSSSTPKIVNGTMAMVEASDGLYANLPQGVLYIDIMDYSNGSFYFNYTIDVFHIIAIGCECKTPGFDPAYNCTKKLVAPPTHMPVTPPSYPSASPTPRPTSTRHPTASPTTPYPTISPSSSPSPSPTPTPSFNSSLVASHHCLVPSEPNRNCVQCMKGFYERNGYCFECDSGAWLSPFFAVAAIVLVGPFVIRSSATDLFVYILWLVRAMQLSSLLLNTNSEWLIILRAWDILLGATTLSFPSLRCSWQGERVLLPYFIVQSFFVAFVVSLVLVRYKKRSFFNYWLRRPAITMANLLFIPALALSFEMFRTRTVNGAHYLARYTSVKTNSSAYFVAAPIALVVLLFFCITLMCFVGNELWVNRRVLIAARTAKFSPLYFLVQAFKPKFYWFPCVELAFLFAITLFLSAVSNVTAACICATFVVCAFVGLLLWLKPLLSKRLQIALVAVFTGFVIALSTTASRADVEFGSMTVFSCFIFIHLVLLGSILFELYGVISAKRLAKRDELSSMAASSGEPGVYTSQYESVDPTLLSSDPYEATSAPLGGGDDGYGTMKLSDETGSTYQDLKLRTQRRQYAADAAARGVTVRAYGKVASDSESGGTYGSGVDDRDASVVRSYGTVNPYGKLSLVPRPDDAEDSENDSSNRPASSAIHPQYDNMESPLLDDSSESYSAVSERRKDTSGTTFAALPSRSIVNRQEKRYDTVSPSDTMRSTVLQRAVEGNADRKGSASAESLPDK